MTDQYFDKVSADIDPFKKILSYIPGFKGYIERQKRRDSDKILRDTVANRFEEQWQRIAAIQRDLVSQGELQYVDDLEAAAIKLRTFIDRIRRARRGYSGLFDAEKINEKELELLYQYDASLLAMTDEVARAIDNVEASIGSDGLPASIRNLTGVAQSCVDAYNRRDESMRAVSAA